MWSSSQNKATAEEMQEVTCEKSCYLLTLLTFSVSVIVTENIQAS